ncbi:MAG TPA: radical SAM family heme chaperone HemW [Candidatus Polarisedimenticolia bacterium]|nr:radical SAM family heme chaperone HemW [Candidatus Polarisedimenticolia bacterium]
MSSEAHRQGDSPLGVYLHAPFCVSHCTYCDFYTRAYAGEGSLGRFAGALAEEIGISSRTLEIAGRPVDSVYFGGGTPSLLTALQISRLLAALRSSFGVEPDAEISLEANPESVTEERLQAFRRVGINRLSLGVQSFEPAILAALGRAHTADRAAQAFHEARAAGFDNVSLDLMLALPGQSPAILREDLQRLLDLGPDHVSAYLLEMDKETALRARIERGELPAVSQDEAAELYETVRSGLTAAGYRQYEISNFALPGKRCRHNLKYWTDAPFAGFGPSAWSYLAGRRSRVAPDLEGYLEAVERRAEPRRETGEADPGARLQEALFAGLRLVEGVDLDDLGRAYGVADPLGSRRGAVLDLMEAGFVSLKGPRLRLAPRSYCVANEIFAVFV